MSAFTTFGEWLHQRRRILGLTQKELAQRVPCAIVTIRKFEAGSLRPSRVFAERLANGLEIDSAERETFILQACGLATPTTIAISNTLEQKAKSATNLLPPLTTFIGRDAEVTAITMKLREAKVRLLSLIGPPGVGKTRLCIEVALQLTTKFQDGVYFVNLAPIRDPALVVATIAQVLGLRERGGIPLIENLKTFLSNRDLLLALDNFEHVLDAAPVVGGLVASAPNLTVMVTSREALYLAPEYRFTVPPLSIPSIPKAHAPQGDYLKSEAVQLFLERALTRNPDFYLNRANAHAIAELCIRLEGLPLGIELAAQRSNQLGPRALLARLNSGLHSFMDNQRDPRQTSLHHAVEWSYQLLSASEQHLLAQLSIFRGGWSLAAAEAICLFDETTPWEVIDGLLSLADKNLVQYEEDESGDLRFTMLEMIREYATEKANHIVETSLLRQRHLDYFLQVAESAEAGLRNPEQSRWLKKLKLDLNNLRAALEWAVEQTGVDDKGLRIAGALSRFWQLVGLHEEGIAWTTQLLNVSSKGDIHVRIKALTGAGMLATWRYDKVTALNLLDTSLSFSHTAGNLRETAYALLWRRAIWLQDKKYKQARQDGERSIALFRTLDDPWGLAYALWTLGWVITSQYESDSDSPTKVIDFMKARALYHESYILFHGLGDRWSNLYTLAGWGDLAFKDKDYRAALTFLTESLEIARETEDNFIIEMLVEQIALVTLKAGWEPTYSDKH